MKNFISEATRVIIKWIESDDFILLPAAKKLADNTNLTEDDTVETLKKLIWEMMRKDVEAVQMSGFPKHAMFAALITYSLEWVDYTQVLNHFRSIGIEG